MSKGKKKQNRIFILLIVSILSIFMCALSVGSVFAWLSDESSEINNHFNPNIVKVEISETDTDDGDDNEYTNTYEMFPDEDISKDPRIEVPKGTLDAWIFVKLEESDNFSYYMTYEVDEEWEALGDEYPGVYYQAVPTSEEDQSLPVLKEDIVHMNEGITKDDLNRMSEKPKLTITGYGIQQAGFQLPVDAWKELNGK